MNLKFSTFLMERPESIADLINAGVLDKDRVRQGYDELFGHNRILLEEPNESEEPVKSNNQPYPKSYDEPATQTLGEYMKADRREDLSPELILKNWLNL